jgi:hypothetical protein
MLWLDPIAAYIVLGLVSTLELRQALRYRGYKWSSRTRSDAQQHQSRTASVCSIRSRNSEVLCAGPLKNPGLQRRSSFLHRSSGMMRVQARQSLGFEATLPATDIVGVAPQNLTNRQVGFALRQQQDRPRAAHILGRQRARTQPVLQFRALTRRQAKLSLSHAP